MPELSSHICPSCGSALKLDENANLFRCEFCGSVFESEKFLYDDTFDQAVYSLKNREFSSAVHTFTGFLDKHPGNPLALKGRLLATAESSSLDEFLDDSNWRYKQETTKVYVDQAPQDYKEYFFCFGKIGSSNLRLTKLTEEKNNITKLKGGVDADMKRYKRLSTFRSLFFTHIYWLIIGSMLSLIGMGIYPKADGHYTNSAYQMRTIISFAVTAAIFLAFVVVMIVTCLKSKAKYARKIKENEKILDQYGAQEQEYQGRIQEELNIRTDIKNAILDSDKVLFESLRKL